MHIYSYMYKFFMTPFATYTQITQQVYVGKEWVKNTHDEVKVEAYSHFEAKKPFGALKKGNTELSEKLKEAYKARLSAEVGLKTAERQAEDQHQKLHIVEINLATEKQIVLDLKVELQRTKDAARVAKEDAEAMVRESYERGVGDTEAWLAEEVAVVCRHYCTESYGVAMDWAGVPADSELRRAVNIFFLEDIREILDTIPSTEQLSTTQAPPLDVEVSKGVEVDEEAQLPVKAKPFKDTIKDVFSQAKDGELKYQVGDS